MTILSMRLSSSSWWIMAAILRGSVRSYAPPLMRSSSYRFPDRRMGGGRLDRPYRYRPSLLLRHGSTLDAPPPPPPQKKNRWKKRLRQRVSNLFSVTGFLSSSLRSLLFASNARSSSDPALLELSRFLQATQIDVELKTSLLHARLLHNLWLLRRVERTLPLPATACTALGTTDDNDARGSEEARRYMKWATAVYGESMIRAAEMDVLGTVDNLLFTKETAARMSDHCGVPVSDILRMDVDYEGDCHHLRHVVAIDHTQGAIVLAIRGTFTLSELLVDVAGFARPFCGGQAHSEMATMAERVWQVARPTIRPLLQQYPDYELVLVGHSLGAGVASLLNILLHQNDDDQPSLLHNNDTNGERMPTKIRCFAYACPPTFFPLEQVPEAVAACHHYMHGQDVVPFLSVHNIRRLCHRLRAVARHELSWREYLSSYNDNDGLPVALVEDVQRAQQEPLAVLPGAPCLMVPAARTVWMKETTAAHHSSHEEEYEYLVCDSPTLAQMGIRLDRRMFTDHFPSRYEHAFHHWPEQRRKQ